MQQLDLSRPGEKKKLIWAAALGLIAILFLWWTLIGFGSGSSNVTRATPSPTPQRNAQNPPRSSATPSAEVANLSDSITEVTYQPTSYIAPAASRNIFAYYEPPKVEKVATTPTPTPTPPPPILLASVSPTNVFARTGDFKLELAGDKFTPALRIYIDGREFPTAYKSPQQLSTTVPASLIATPGTRQVMVHTPDNQLFSNALAINVQTPPVPNFMYIGIIGRPNRVEDIALVQDRNNKNIINALRGDVIGGRFRVTSISEKELVLTDTTLKIKHTIAMSEGDKSGSLLSRPTPKVDAEDDEP
jgi:hypothetical protein